MDMSKLGLYRLLGRRMDWLSERQEVLAHNVANSDTPGFRPSYLIPFDFRTALRDSLRMRPARTDSAHLSGAGAQGAEAMARQDRKNYETALDGNAVVLEEQLMKVGRNNADYQLATQIYRKNVAMLKMAIGRGGA